MEGHGRRKAIVYSVAVAADFSADIRINLRLLLRLEGHGSPEILQALSIRWAL